MFDDLKINTYYLDVGNCNVTTTTLCYNDEDCPDTENCDYQNGNIEKSTCKIKDNGDFFKIDWNDIDKINNNISQYKNIFDEYSAATYDTSLMIQYVNIPYGAPSLKNSNTPINDIYEYLNLDNSSNQYSIEIIMTIIFTDFWYQYFNKLKMLINTDSHVDDFNIKDIKFEFTNKYILLDPNNNKCNFSFSKATTNNTIKFNIKLDEEIDDIDISSNYIIIDEEFGTENERQSFKNILDLYDPFYFKKYIYFYRENSEVLNNYYLLWQNYKIVCKIIILISLYYYLQNIGTVSESFTQDDKNIKIRFLLKDIIKDLDLDLNNFKSDCDTIQQKISKISALEGDGTLRYIEKSEQIKNAKNDTSNLFHLNKEILTKSQELKHKKNIISDEKKKLDKINIVLIFTIILFIIISLILLFSYKINNSIGYQLSLVFIFLIIGVYILIYTYISISVNNVNISDKLSVFKKLFNSSDLLEDFTNPPVVETTENCTASTGLDIIKCILNKYMNRDEFNDIYLYKEKYQSDYYKIIKPLLDNELKDFNNKKQGSKLHNNIADFNLSSNKRDLKVNIETIMYLMNISLLIAILLISKYYFPNFLKLIGIICIMLFIILSFIYFARVLKIVRTKSYNYYWQKPELLKKLV